MFIRSITTTAILLACSAAHAQAAGPMSDAALNNVFADPSYEFPVAEAMPDVKWPNAFAQPNALEERPRDERGYRQGWEEISKLPGAAMPPLWMGREADQNYKEFYVNADTNMAHPSMTRYYDQRWDAPAHATPLDLPPETQSHADPRSQGDPRMGVAMPENFQAKVNPLGPAYAPMRSWDMSFAEDRNAWSCIAFNGQACPPSMHRVALAFWPQWA